jgi:hypothetical protein
VAAAARIKAIQEAAARRKVIQEAEVVAASNDPFIRFQLRSQLHFVTRK